MLTYESAIEAAVNDGYNRLRHSPLPSFPVFVRPIEDIGIGIYCGPTAPAPHWMQVNNTLLSGYATAEQNANTLRQALRSVPVYSLSFRDSTGALTPDARSTLC